MIDALNTDSRPSSPAAALNPRAAPRSRTRPRVPARVGGPNPDPTGADHAWSLMRPWRRLIEKEGWSKSQLSLDFCYVPWLNAPFIRNRSIA
jgi:hypothetical protein